MERKITIKKGTYWLARLTVGISFVVAGAMKLRAPGEFESSIRHYHLISDALAHIVAAYLPSLEIVTGGTVLCCRQNKGALVLVLFLCCLFSGAVSSAWLRGIDIDCGCFGDTYTATVPLVLVRLGILKVAAIYLFRRVILPT
jgi:putative oxidoreductase